MSTTRSAVLARRRPGGGSTSWVLLGTVVNAVTTYVLLGVVLRTVTVPAAADFSVLWALVVTAGLGFFLPLEQETARRVAHLPADASAALIWTRSVRVALAVAAALAIPAALWWGLAGQPLTALAFVLAVAGYAIQFSSRGVLSGRRRLARYGAVTAVDACLRVVLALVLAVAGVRTAGLYQLAVAVSALAAGVAAVWWSRPDRPATAAGAARTTHFGRDAAKLIVAAACMQALLNSGTLLAKAFSHPDQVALVATLLVTMTIARLPAFVFQSLQATYLTRLAGSMHRGEGAAVRKLLLVLGTAVLVVGVGVTLGAAAVGPWAVSTFFGDRYQVTRVAAVLVAASVAAYLAASVANDVSVAVGAHRRIALAWPSGLALAAVVAAVVTDLTTRSVLPLGVGGLVALAVLVPGIRSRVRAMGAAS